MSELIDNLSPSYSQLEDRVEELEYRVYLKDRGLEVKDKRIEALEVENARLRDAIRCVRCEFEGGSWQARQLDNALQEEE